MSGDAHFDDDEPFTTRTSSGINLDWVAIHEFGHSFGLEHSNVRESIMYPWYKGFIENIDLTYDDIQGIQALYGKCKGSNRLMVLAIYSLSKSLSIGGLVSGQR